jgi:hypothetical protein
MLSTTTHHILIFSTHLNNTRNQSYHYQLPDFENHCNNTALSPQPRLIIITVND